MISRFLRRAAAVSLGALGACSTARSAETDDSAGAAPIVVRAEPAASTVRPRVVTASGVVEPRTSVDVAFQVPGKVVAAGPDEGDIVREGQLLAQLDLTDYELTVAQTAALAEHAAAERDRHRPLLAVGSVAPNDLERMEAAARQTAAAAALARKRLADARLRSPIKGIVARRAIERGSTVAAGQSAFTLVDLDVVEVRVGVPEADVDMLRVGLPATVRLPALGPTTFAGRVTSVGVAADPTTRTYAVQISVPNPSHRLKAGMVAEATVQGNRQSTAITVPASAVLQDADGANFVYLLDARTNRVHRRRVTVGATWGGGVELTGGLAAGDMVVVAGQQRVRDGAIVLTSSAEGAAEGAR
ncbi:MAG: efflux RND transporter periplasmic adaptor subunit [Gemmatimonadaceae bacterium]